MLSEAWPLTVTAFGFKVPAEAGPSKHRADENAPVFALEQRSLATHCECVRYSVLATALNSCISPAYARRP